MRTPASMAMYTLWNCAGLIVSQWGAERLAVHAIGHGFWCLDVFDETDPTEVTGSSPT